MVDMDYDYDPKKDGSPFGDPNRRHAGGGYDEVGPISPWVRRFTGVIIGFVLLVISFFAAQTPPDGTSVVHPVQHPVSEQRDSIVSLEARRAGVPVSLALAVSHVENWTGDSLAVSPRGAVGLMQVIPKYWQHEFEDECGCGSLFNRQRNACKGVRVLAFYLDKYGDTDKALRAYHGSLALHAAGDAYVALVLNEVASR